MKLEDLVHEAPGNQRCALQKNTQPCSRHAQCCVPVVLGGWGEGRGGDGGRRQEGSIFSGNPCIVMAAGHLQLTSLCDWLSL